MKILHIIESMNPDHGGPVEVIHQFQPHLAAEGHTQEVLCLDPPDRPWLRDVASPIYILGPSLGKYHYNSRAAQWIRDHQTDYDCCIVHGVWQYCGVAAWQALRHSKTPYFLFAHGALDPWFRDTYPLKHIKKSIYWRLIANRVLRDARAVLFTCEEERSLARLSFQPYRCTEAISYYSTSGPEGDAETQRRALLEKFPDLAGKRLLLFLSRIHPKKGCDLLIDAFAEVARSEPNLHLVMAGPDQVDWKPKLQAKAEAAGVAQRITWTGMLSGDLKWGAFHASDAFTLPSHQENFGIAVAEALACGLPVLISNKVNIWREIQADSAGFIGNDDFQGTLSCLKQWLACNAEELAQMRQRAVSCFTNRFTMRSAAKNLIQTLHDHGVGSPNSTVLNS